MSRTKPTEIKIGLQFQDIFSRFKRKPFLFVGSGLSLRYLNLPSWEMLLKQVCLIIKPEDELYYSSLIASARSKGLDMNDNWTKYPAIATEISNELDKYFFSEEKFAQYREKYQEDLMREVPPLKIIIKDIILSSKRNGTFHSEKYSIERMKDKISGVITTNYDTFFEDIYNEFKVIISEKGMINSDLLYEAEIYKINGSVSEAKSIVIDQNDYQKREKYQRYLSSKLLTLFVEYPIIFLGYSISDKNIKDIFADLSICLTEEQKDKIKDNLLFIDYTNDPSKQSISMKNEHEIQMNYIKLHKFSLLYNHIAKYVKDGLPVKLLRKVKELTRSIVLSGESNHERIFTASLYNTELKEDDIAIMIADKNSVFEFGYAGKDYNSILQDIVFDKKLYDPELIFNVYVPNSNKLSNELPFYYYKSKMNMEPKIYRKKLIKNLDELLFPSLQNEKSKNNYIVGEIKEIEEKGYAFSREIRHILFNISNIDVVSLELYLRNNFQRFVDSEKANDKSLFKKLIAAYDYKKYYK